MSKGKFKRQRQRTNERAQKQAEEIRRLHAIVVAAEKKEESADGSHSNENDKGQYPMGFRSFIKSKHFTDVCLTIFTLVLAGVSVFQALITRNQLGVMRNDERAWIQVRLATEEEKKTEGPIFQLNSGTVVRVPLMLTNIGKTVARNSSAVVNVEVVKDFESPHIECIENKCQGVYFGTLPIVFPNEKDEVPNATPYLATDAQAAAWISGDVYVAVYGVIIYDDVFGDHHWTKFCNWYGAKMGRRYQAKQCTLYNDAN